VLDLLIRRDLQPGNRIPSEQELIESPGVSRATLREGLQLLEQEGVIHTQHGSGRYLIAHPQSIALDITDLRSVTQLMQEHGLEHTVLVLEAQEKAANREVAQALQISTGQPVVSVERAHRTQGGPDHLLDRSLRLQPGQDALDT
jgi:GntR family transcriptional regulator